MAIIAILAAFLFPVFAQAKVAAMKTSDLTSLKQHALSSILRLADSAKIANLAQIVNGIAPILTLGNPMVLKPIFYPIEMMSKRRKGMAVQVKVVGPMIHSKMSGDAPSIDSNAILNGNQLSVYLVNQSLDKEPEVLLKVAGMKTAKQIDGEIVTGRDPKAANSFDQQSLVVASN